MCPDVRHLQLAGDQTHAFEDSDSAGASVGDEVVGRVVPFLEVIKGIFEDLLAEVLAESWDCEVHFAVACGLDKARGDEPVSVFGHDVGFGLEDGSWAT